MRRVEQACLFAFGCAQARVGEIAGEVVEGETLGGCFPVEQAVFFQFRERVFCCVNVRLPDGGGGGRVEVGREDGERAPALLQVFAQ